MPTTKGLIVRTFKNGKRAFWLKSLLLWNTLFQPVPLRSALMVWVVFIPRTWGNQLLARVLRSSSFRLICNLCFSILKGLWEANENPFKKKRHGGSLAKRVFLLSCLSWNYKQHQSASSGLGSFLSRLRWRADKWKWRRTDRIADFSSSFRSQGSAILWAPPFTASERLWTRPLFWITTLGRKDWSSPWQRRGFLDTSHSPVDLLLWEVLHLPSEQPGLASLLLGTWSSAKTNAAPEI